MLKDDRIIFSGAKSILFDDTNKALSDSLEKLNIKEFNEKEIMKIFFMIKILCFYILVQEVQAFQVAH